MEHIKVNTAEKRRNGIACKGKIVMIHATDKVDDNYAIITDKGWVKPIIISETEPFDAGDIIAHNEYGLGKVISRKGTGQYWICEFASKRNSNRKDKTDTVIGIFKVLAFPENFSTNQLNLIADGKLRDGDEVMVECFNRPLPHKSKYPEGYQYANALEMDGDSNYGFESLVKLYYPEKHIKFAPIRKAFTTPMLEFLRSYLKNTPKEQIQKEWKDITEEFNSKEPEWVEPIEKDETWDDIRLKAGKIWSAGDSKEDFGDWYETYLKENYNPPTKKENENKV